MTRHITVTCKVSGYSNTHDGYCSGNECDYQELDRIFEFEISNDRLDSLNIANLIKECRSTFPALMMIWGENTSGKGSVNMKLVLKMKKQGGTVHDSVVKFSHFIVTSYKLE